MPKQSASYDRAEYDPHPVGITTILLLVSIAAERSDAKKACSTLGSSARERARSLHAAPRCDRDNNGRRCNTVESRASMRRQVFFFEV